MTRCRMRDLISFKGAFRSRGQQRAGEVAAKVEEGGPEYNGRMDDPMYLPLVFLAHRGVESGEAGEGHAALAAHLQKMVSSGRAAWPDLGLAPEVYVRHLAERAAAQG